MVGLKSFRNTVFRVGTLCGVVAMLVLVTGCDPCMNNPCNDGAFCNGTETCTVDDASGEAVCGDGVAVECTAPEVCAEALDACVDPCADVDCNDDDACTEDVCTFTTDPETGEFATECSNTAIVCDDGDACTTDGCETAIGCVNVITDCDDGDACTEDSCDSATGCVNAPNLCDDGDACTDDVCVGGACEHSETDCDDADACTDDSCDSATGCVYAPTDTCDDDDLCTDDSCDPATGDCAYDAVVCDVVGEECDPATGDCVDAGCEEDADCDDGDDCTDDTCDAAECANDPVVCDQGFACNPATGDCEEIACTENADCDDDVACTTDNCVVATGECVFATNDALCDDGLHCTGAAAADVCDPDDGDAGADGCVRDGDPCGGLTPVCDEVDDECDPCGSDADCDDGATCTTDNCEAGGSCTNTPVHVLCDDDLYCTDDDICDPDDDDADETTGCVNETDPCECAHPGDPCGGEPGDRMLCRETNNGECVECGANGDCDDGITCTLDTCAGATGVCTNDTDDDSCPNPDFCDGVDECDPNDGDADANGCVQPGDPCGAATPICDEADDVCEACQSNADCDDDVDCTDDFCNDPGAGECNNVDNCPGLETCNLGTGVCE